MGIMVVSGNGGQWVRGWSVGMWEVIRYDGGRWVRGWVRGWSVGTRVGNGYNGVQWVRWSVGMVGGQWVCGMSVGTRWSVGTRVGTTVVGGYEDG